MSREPVEKLIARFFPERCCTGATFLRELAHRLPVAGALLDLGCGVNRTLAPYRTPVRKVWGVDFRPHPQLAHAEWFRALEPDGRVPFPDASFDLVASCWVLEHVGDAAAFLAEVARLLRPGGAFVSLSINAGHYVTWLTRLMGLLPHTVTQAVVKRLYGRPAHDTFPTFYRLNTPAALRRHARVAGLQLAALRQHVSFDYFAFSPALQRAAVHVDHLLDRVSPDLGRIYFVATLRKPDVAATHRRAQGCSPIEIGAEEGIA